MSLVGTGLMLSSAVLNALKAGADLKKGKLEAEGLMSSEEEKRLRELKRRQQTTGLGLEDDAVNQMQKRIAAPLQAIARGQELQEGRALAGADVGSGAYFRSQQARQAETQRASLAAADAIAAADAEARQRQQEEIIALGQLKNAERIAKEQAKLDKTKFVADAALTGVEMVGEGMSIARAMRQALGLEPKKSEGDKDEYLEMIGESDSEWI